MKSLLIDEHYAALELKSRLEQATAFDHHAVDLLEHLPWVEVLDPWLLDLDLERVLQEHTVQVVQEVLHRCVERAGENLAQTVVELELLVFHIPELAVIDLERLESNEQEQLVAGNTRCGNALELRVDLPPPVPFLDVNHRVDEDLEPLVLHDDLHTLRLELRHPLGQLSLLGLALHRRTKIAFDQVARNRRGDLRMCDLRENLTRHLDRAHLLVECGELRPSLVDEILNWIAASEEHDQGQYQDTSSNITKNRLLHVPSLRVLCELLTDSNRKILVHQ